MEKIKDVLTNLSGVSVGTWVRLVLMVVSLVNMALVALGKSPVEIDSSNLYTILSVVFAVIVGIVSYWKNNSFTKAAQAADEYLHNQGFANEDKGE